MPTGMLPALRPVENSVIEPLGVIRPIALVVTLCSVNQRLPSGPAAMNTGERPGSVENSVIDPFGVIRPIALVLPRSVNQRLPSGPGARPAGEPPAFRPVENSLTWASGAAAAVPPQAMGASAAASSETARKARALGAGRRSRESCGARQGQVKIASPRTIEVP